MRPVISLVALKENSILLVKKKETWILPGGKPEENENDLECLKRELREELPKLKVKNLKRYRSFSGIAPYRKDKIKVIVYFGNVSGSIKPEAEIKDSKWIRDFNNLEISDTTQKIIKRLKEEKYID